MSFRKLFAMMVMPLSAVLFSCQYGDEMDAVAGIKTVADGVFYMEYEGDYGFDRYLEQGGAKNVEELTHFISTELQKGEWTSPSKKNRRLKELEICPGDFGCSSIVVKDSQKDGRVIYGRNYDWEDCRVLIVHSKPQNGYESISTCCLSHIGLNKDWNPSGKFMDDAFVLAAIYVPMDGMNEKGLYIADLMAGDKELTAQERGNASVTTTDAIRLVLDRAATVDEALALLKSHDMHSVIGYAHHFAIADAGGRSVAVEYAGNEMFVCETPVLTNHYVTECPRKDDGTNAETENSRTRFNLLNETLAKKDLALTSEEAAHALESVRAGQYGTKGLTVWSAVFEPAESRVSYYFREDYGTKITFDIK